MTTGAFSQNISKLFSELKLVTDNLLFIYVLTVKLWVCVFSGVRDVDAHA